VGKALKQWRGKRPIVSTKAGRLAGSHDYSPAAIRHSVKRSLDLLGLDRIDLLFVHEPEFVPAAQRPALIDELLRLKSDGYAARLGLGGGDCVAWDEFLAAGCFDVVLVFNRIDACCLDAEADLPRIRQAGAALYQGSPLHMGLLGARFENFVMEPPSWLTTAVLDAANRIKAFADAHGMSLPSLAHRFAFAMDAIDRVVLGACNMQQLRASLDDWRQGPISEKLFDDVCSVICCPGGR
jgi:aryl-alcohol dehydrogenase-like predicted oxidoreductase